MQTEEIFKEKLLDTFSYLIDYLEENHLRWFAGFGTLIGAIRHEGLIPWDDDIDILMPREDYNKLISSFNKNANGYYLVNRETQGYPFPFAKVCDGNSTIVETKTISIAFGVYIDIFPYDEFNLNSEDSLKIKLEYEKLHRHYERACNTYSTSYLLSCIRQGRLLTLKQLLIDVLVHRSLKNRYMSRMKQIEKLSVSDGTSLIVLSGIYKKKDIYDPAWFKHSLFKKFENLSVRVPIGYDECLTSIYGNYLELPPVEKRCSKHSHVYENLSENMPIDKARKYYTSTIDKKTK